MVLHGTWFMTRDAELGADLVCICVVQVNILFMTQPIQPCTGTGRFCRIFKLCGIPVPAEAKAYIFLCVCSQNGLTALHQWLHHCGVISEP